MEKPSTGSVLADFDGTSFRHRGSTTTFSRREDDWIVTTEGPNGDTISYEVAYTFGVHPLQQFLLPTEGGRLQAHGIAWDTSALDLASPGMQAGTDTPPSTESDPGRWFPLYDDVDGPDDPLHWTRPLQNWNQMCAECHSTDVRKGYDPEDNRYETTFAEIDVSCEACHGPGSEHVRRARAAARLGQDLSSADPDLGLTVRLRDASGGGFAFASDAVTAERSAPRSGDSEIAVCARCHSRRSTIAEEPVAGQPIGDTHRVALLDEGLYHADGQIDDEVYVYGSFLQSRMHHAGVSCSDCHDPHSNGLRAPGNLLCAQCHRADVFDTIAHHRHAPNSEGAQCVSCHMPSKTYMQIDARRDHSFRIPRPDLAAELGTPDACTACHQDRDPTWAADAIDTWHGTDRPRRGEPHFATAIHAAREGRPDAARALAALIERREAPAIARATALTLLPRAFGTDPAGLESALRTGIADPDPLVRRAAAEALRPLADLDPGRAIAIGAPLLEDPVRDVRAEAGAALATLASPAPAGASRSLDPASRRAVTRALEEYRETQHYATDRPEARMNLGNLAARVGDAAEAERWFRSAIALDRTFVPGHVNLADLLRSRGRESEAFAVLREALAEHPGDADLLHATGLAEVLRGEIEKAIAHLRSASEARPDDARYRLVYAVALHDTGDPSGAIRVLERARARGDADPTTLQTLLGYALTANETDIALACARDLLRYTPGDEGLERLVGDLEKP